MGYQIQIQGQRIWIKKENFEAAKKALIEIEGGAWTNCPEAALSLDDLLQRWRWVPWILEEAGTSPIKEASIGDITHLEFSGEKQGDDEQMFQALAPFIEPGCYVEILGEEDARWRWLFDGKGMKEIGCVLDWDDKCEALDAILKHKEVLPFLLKIHPVLDGLIEKALRPKPRKKAA